MLQTVKNPISEIRQPLKALIAVCTYKRPKMLETCLNSLWAQVLPDAVNLHIAVIDNDPAMSAHKTYVRSSIQAEIPHSYLHQPKRGIAAARNKAIEFALDIGADFLCFIDDDETAHDRWALNLCHEDYWHIPILGGQQVMIYPKIIPQWARPRKDKTRPEEGAALKFAYTNNVRYSADVLRAGIRFDESIGLGGGSDHIFCADAKRAGFACHYTNRAITWEAAHPERHTVPEMIARTHRCQVTKTMWQVKEKGRLRVAASSIVPFLYAFPNAGFYVILGALAYPFSEFRSMRSFLHAGKKMAKAMGRWHGVRGYIPQVYSKTVGG